jgi:hypothetical protein
LNFELGSTQNQISEKHSSTEVVNSDCKHSEDKECNYVKGCKECFLQNCSSEVANSSWNWLKLFPEWNIIGKDQPAKKTFNTNSNHCSKILR